MESSPSLLLFAKEVAGLYTTDEAMQQRLGTAFDLDAEGRNESVASECLQNCTFSKVAISSLQSDVDDLKDDVRGLIYNISWNWLRLSCLLTINKTRNVEEKYTYRLLSAICHYDSLANSHCVTYVRPQ
ncbi:hypothetical protein GEMRC1_011792 [Eukaryota sp. GEM-RC1]